MAGDVHARERAVSNSCRDPLTDVAARRHGELRKEGSRLPEQPVVRTVPPFIKIIVQ